MTAVSFRALRFVLLFSPLLFVGLFLCSCGHGPAVSKDGPAKADLTPQERAYLKTHGPLRYAPDPAFPPFEFFDDKGNAVGIAPELLAMVAKSIGAELQVARYPGWSSVIAAAKRGDIDVLTTVLRTPERETFLLFTRPFMSSPYVLFVNSSRAGLSSISDLRAQRVAVEENSGSHAWLIANHPELNVVPVPNVHAGLVMISTGKADAVLENLAVGVTVARENGLTNVRILQEPLYESAEHFAVPSSEAELLPIIQKGLDAVPKRTLSALFVKWAGRDLSLQRPSLEPWERNALIVLLALVALGAAWVFTLKRAVRARTKELRESEARFKRFFEKFRTVFQASPVAMSISRLEDGRFMEVNESFLALFEGSREEIVGRTAHELGFWVDPDDRRRMVRMVKEEGRARNLEPEGVSLRGRRFQGRYHAERIVLDGEPCILSIIEDTTEQKRAEKLLREKEMEILQSKKMEAIGRLAGGMAHDFNNILAGILGNAEILAERLQDQPILKTYAEQVANAAERAGRLTRQLLSYARKGQYQQAPVDLHGVIRDAVAILEGTLDKRITISLGLMAQKATVIGDQAQLESVILNLAINARDAMPEGGELAISTANPAPGAGEVGGGRFIEVTVSDTGSGMTKEQKQHLFEPFYTTKGPERGTGLGLASVYGAVQGHGGTISVQSEVGKGTTVTIMLPVADEAAPAQEAKATAQAMAQKAARIMVVDDEAPILDVVKEVLENAGYQAETFSSAPEAVDHFLKEPDAVDLVLLDMMMPRMSGLEVFRAMKGARPSVRAILITGYSVDEKAQELMAEGVRGYLHKPFKRAELIEKIREVLAE